MQNKEKNKILNNKALKNRRNRIFWGITFICVALLSIITITSFNKCFSLNMFLNFIKNSSCFFIILAICCVILFILFEGFSISSICKEFGYGKNYKKSFLYAAADIYFSAITPSASGGQPASAYFMIKDGIPISITTLSLLYTLLMYSVSIIIIAIIGFLFNPTLLFQLNWLAKTFILIGFIIQFSLIFCFYCFIYKKEFLNKICKFFLRLLVKFHFLKNIDDKLAKLNEIMTSYQQSANLLKGKRKLLTKVLFFNIMQRVCQIGVIVFTFLATGGKIQEVMVVFSIQSFVIIGAYSMPIPGAIGVTDYLMLHGFKKIMTPVAATNLELFSRSLSFYFCVIICGIVVFVNYLIIRRSSKYDRSI